MNPLMTQDQIKEIKEKIQLDVDREMVEEKRRRDQKKLFQRQNTRISDKRKSVGWQRQISLRTIKDEFKLDKSKPLLWDRTDLVCQLPYEQRGILTYKLNLGENFIRDQQVFEMLQLELMIEDLEQYVEDGREEMKKRNERSYLNQRRKKSTSTLIASAKNPHSSFIEHNGTLESSLSRKQSMIHYNKSHLTNSLNTLDT